MKAQLAAGVAQIVICGFGCFISSCVCGIVVFRQRSQDLLYKSLALLVIAFLLPCWVGIAVYATGVSGYGPPDTWPILLCKWQGYFENMYAHIVAAASLHYCLMCLELILKTDATLAEVRYSVHVSPSNTIHPASADSRGWWQKRIDKVIIAVWLWAASVSLIFVGLAVHWDAIGPQYVECGLVNHLWLGFIGLQAGIFSTVPMAWIVGLCLYHIRRIWRHQAAMQDSLRPTSQDCIVTVETHHETHHDFPSYSYASRRSPVPSDHSFLDEGLQLDTVSEKDERESLGDTISIRGRSFIDIEEPSEKSEVHAEQTAPFGQLVQLPDKRPGRPSHFANSLAWIYLRLALLGLLYIGGQILCAATLIQSLIQGYPPRTYSAADLSIQAVCFGPFMVFCSAPACVDFAVDKWLDVKDKLSRRPSIE
ncbi:uncharacterized protein L969DRAFT_16366 [Mixia osmundae IAM 14324]|uniref:Uncharacterized protein n=1 Tax=Mixia osmundae (strain CBS 9802 / IAM 14324 / JCM 22182 / KY 12970) TaxID=764103 RepID=G7DU84_MIXOS|nr:uncharacterized protein L969DRAFT_16366 [Mixia osmundae IAM 14324]KEI41012.1 hypothetical protein L969DRAFT_16366 [Mixia osmundae IAM 14324]GAA94144.1 hypothetical protein E5Q_00792 [Mixia osmundae IAM 14324]